MNENSSEVNELIKKIQKKGTERNYTHLLISKNLLKG